MSAGNPDSTNGLETGQHPWPHDQSPPHLANQATSLASSPTFLSCGCMLQQPEHVLGSLMSLPFLKMSPPSVLLFISAWLKSPYPPPTMSYASFFRKTSLIAPIRSCLLPLIPRMPAMVYLILEGSELVFILISCLRALESQKAVLCPVLDGWP